MDWLVRAADATFVPVPKASVETVDGAARVLARDAIASRVTVRAAATASARLRDALADDTAFEAWYRDTMPRVYSFLMSRCGFDIELAEELTQRTFVAAVEQRWRFDGRSDVTTWLCAIARHKLADHYRRLDREQRRQMQLEVREIEAAGVRTPGTAEDRELIAEAFRSLPPAQQAVLAFVAVDGMSVPQAAALLGKNRLATQSLLHRARESFRRAYRREFDR